MANPTYDVHANRFGMPTATELQSSHWTLVSVL
jgi:hypothetical protein